MKKILLIIAITFCIFQMVVLADPIDIGSPAIGRASSIGTYTIIAKENPANASGKITQVEIWADETLGNCEVATFEEVSPNYFTTRDSHFIGGVTAGAKRTFSGLDIDVEIGDYIGLYFSSGRIEKTDSGAGVWKSTGDAIPCTNRQFSLAANDTISLYGIGETPPVGWDHKWNTITISKWNTKEFTKWNGLE